MDVTWWAGSEQFVGAAVAAAVADAVAVVAVRIAGRRTLAQLSAFDIVVTIALGTLVSSTALPSDPSVADGVAVLLTLLVLQVVVAAVRQRSGTARRLLDFAPRRVVDDGRVDLRRAPTTAQLTRADLESLLRRQGVTDLAEVRLVVLEPTGTISVLRRDEGGPTGLFEPEDQRDRR